MPRVLTLNCAYSKFPVFAVTMKNCGKIVEKITYTKIIYLQSQGSSCGVQGIWFTQNSIYMENTGQIV